MTIWQPATWFTAAGNAGHPRRTNEIMDLEWREAEALWRARQAIAPAPDATAAVEFQKIFYDAAGERKTPDWQSINEAERLLAAVLTEAQLKTQYSLLLALAGSRALASLGKYPNDAAFAALSEGDKRDVYGALLYELQAGFIEGRFVRHLRDDVANTLWRYGLCVSAVSIAVPFIWLFFTWLGLRAQNDASGASPPPLVIDETIFIIAAVACAGALGAFFSRAMLFQTDIASLSFDTVQQTYVARMLRLRLLIGVIGAMIFYFFICGKFVGGGLFPIMSAGMVTEQTTWTLHLVGQATKVAAKAKAAGVPAITELSPNGEFAKLLVWSFLAGFSERLVPDTLSQLEKKSADALQAPTPRAPDPAGAGGPARPNNGKP